MNFRLLSHTMGYILWVEAGFLLLPALTACIYAETCWQQFLLTALLCAAAGTVLHLIPVKKTQMHSRDGFAAVALSWVLLSLFGALPYVFTGAMTSYIDALFETVSGLTTTGSSTFTAVSHLPRSVLLWRSLTQWMGGMGVLVLFLALTPKLGEGAVFLMRAESPGPIKSKLVPKVGGTAKILYLIYVVLTLCEVLALRLAGESWFSAVCHSFTTMATGGFSIYDTSLAGASKAVMWIVTVFSFLAGVNFSLMFLAVRGKLKEVLRSEELRIYVGIVAAATLLLCINLRVQAGVPFGDSITDAAFQTVTIMTTTGFATVDFSLWPTFCRMALVMLMFTGACAGSTGGGIKTTTIFVLAQEIRCIFSKQRPGAFRRALPANAIAKASTIGLLGMLVVCCTTFLLCILEPGLPFISLLFEAVSAYSTAGLSTGITAQLCLAAKLVLIFTMYTGRVGAFTLLSLWVERPEPNAHFTEEAITIG